MTQDDRSPTATVSSPPSSVGASVGSERTAADVVDTAETTLRSSTQVADVREQTAPSAAPAPARTAEQDKPRPPALEVFVDLPNFEIALRDEGWPDLMNYAKFGNQLAHELPGHPYYLKRVWVFASVRDFDPATGVGRLGHEPFVRHLRAIQQSTSKLVQLVLSHRIQNRRMGRWDEKGVDVNLTTAMVEGACDGRYDAALLVANDSDYYGAIRTVRARGKTVFWGYVGTQHSDNDYLRLSVDRGYNLRRDLIRNCQFT